MNCDQAKTEIIAYLKGELTDEQEQKFMEHLAGCPACRKDLDAARKLLTWTEAASEVLTVETLKKIVNKAIDDSASDVHLEPQKDGSLRVRYRIDGVLHEVDRIPSANRHGIISRLKMISEMNIAEESLPQEGRFDLEIAGKGFYDVRVSVIPLVLGESVAIRILDKSSGLLSLDQTGISDKDLEKVKRLTSRPMGIIFTSGPAGSGKTTVLYSLLRTFSSGQNKVMTIEDPVEHLIPGVDQLTLNRRTGLDTAAAIRATMRQDPDIIMTTDIPDSETANLCVQAALAGHILLSQFHTKNAVDVIDRLRELDVRDHLIAASLAGATCQRLIRKVCESCGEDVNIDLNDPIIQFFGIIDEDIQNHKIRHGRGCESCRQTGYKGRTTLFEVLEMDRELASLISNGACSNTILEAARQKGFHTMWDDAKEKILAGITTPEEAFRVLV
jgi:type IV pilus assembly protein PilB